MGIPEYSYGIGGRGLSYAIDDQDRLVRVDAGFYEFAEENEWDGADHCLGRSLWDFVAGEEVRRLQRLVVRRLREGRGAVELGFRCDAPALRREMELRISSNPTGRIVLFRTSLRFQHPRRQQPLLDPAAERGEEVLAMCSWCDRFLVGGAWVEAEVATARLDLFRRDSMPALQHRICEECDDRLLAA
ncbi:MAG: hypothetical protein R2725_00705 [Solirubrobacterales bacterium]